MNERKWKIPSTTFKRKSKNKSNSVENEMLGNMNLTMLKNWEA